jgi:hypothetical protein
MLLGEIKDQVHLLVEESDEKILKAVKAMLEAYNQEKWPDDEIAAFNEDVQVAEDEYKKGEIITHEQVVKLSGGWQESKK